MNVPKKNQALILITLLCITLGILMGLQFKAVKKSNQDEGVQQQRLSQITLELRKAKEEAVAFENKLKETNKKLEEYESANSHSTKWAEILQKELDDARIIAGVTELEGPGVTVLLDDNKVAAQNADSGKVDPNVFLIHDEDILKVVNELKAAGAEAISVNNERITATSGIRCVGPVININDTRIVPPFEIVAIGNPEALEGALNLPKGVVDNLTFWGVQVTIKKSSILRVPSLKEGIQYKYAKPVQKEGE